MLIGPQFWLWMLRCQEVMSFDCQVDDHEYILSSASLKLSSGRVQWWLPRVVDIMM